LIRSNYNSTLLDVLKNSNLYNDFLIRMVLLLCSMGQVLRAHQGFVEQLAAEGAELSEYVLRVDDVLPSEPMRQWVLSCLYAFGSCSPPAWRSWTRCWAIAAH
jgi:hypothetical protein